MNLSYKSIALGVALATVAAANAQSNVNDPTLSLIYGTDAGHASVNTTNTQRAADGRGVGYNQSPDLTGFFPNSPDPAHSESQFDEFLLPAVQTPGEKFQIGVHGFAHSVAGQSTVEILASIVDGSAPGAAAVVKDIPILITSQTPATTGGPSSDKLWYSSTFTLPTGLLANHAYMIAFSGGAAGGASPANWANVFTDLQTSTYPHGGISTDRYQTLNNSDYLGDGSSAMTDKELAFRLYAAPVPEPASIGAIAIGLVAFLRRRKTA